MTTSLLTQVAMAFVLAALLFAFHATYRRDYLRLWGLAWLAHALSFAITAFITRYMARPGLSITWWRLGASWFSQIFAYLHALWLFEGTRALVVRSVAPTRRTVAIFTVSALLATLVLLPRTFFGEDVWTMYVVRVGARSLVAGIAFLVTSTLAAPSAERGGGLARRMVRVGFIVYGLLQLYRAVHTIATALGHASLGSMSYVGFIDVVLEAALGVALLSWMLEDERARADEHADAARRARSSLHSQEDRFRRLIENVGDVITVVDGAGLIRYASPAVTRVLGYEQQDLLGVSNDDLLDPGDREAGRLAIAAAVREPDGIQRATWRCRHKDSSYRIVESDLSCLPGAEGNIEVVINSRDVTERRALEERIGRIQRLDGLGRLAGGVAHDFNNLLTVVFGAVAIAKEEVGRYHGAFKELEQIEQTASRAATLTRQLLTFARQGPGEARVVDLNGLVRDLLNLLRRLIGEDVILIDATSAEPTLVRVDPGQIEQVIVNLAVNARDAMPRGGKLHIEVTQWLPPPPGAPERADLGPVPYADLVVRDTGTGIPLEARSHVFEPFFTTKGPGKGTGLGLATSYGIVRQHGGHIWFEDAPGGGTAFHVLLPGAPDSSMATEDSASGIIMLGRGETILIVEDDPTVRASSIRTLRDHGYDVLAAENGEQALAITLSGRCPDLVMTDLVMPSVGGVDLARRLKTARPDVRVVFTTGYSERADLDRVDPQDLLRKPFSPDRLLLFVRAKLAPHRGPSSRDPVRTKSPW